MVKEPRPGRVKSRLGRETGMTSAAWWFRHQVRGLLCRLEDPRWDLVLAVTPDREGLRSRVWPAHLPRLPQGRGNLGDRMARALASSHSGPVCVIGADIPGIRRDHIVRAFGALGDHEAVLGPAPDGGYWLIGLKNARPPPKSMFLNVRWSSEHAMTDTVRSLGDMSIAFVETLRDVDTVADLRMTAPHARDT